MTFPLASSDGDYFLRTDFNPSRIFKKSGNRWVKIADDTKRVFSSANRILDGFINNTTQTTNTDGEYHDLPHVDRKDKHIVLLYYVNDTDGDTILFDNDLNIIKRVSPKKNRVLIFNGNILHAGCSPIQSKKRVGINFNFGIRNE